MRAGQSASVDAVVAQSRLDGRPYHEVLRVESMSAGVVVLAAGAIDTQSPHGEDEVYHIVRGRASFRHGDRDREVGPGDVLFVPAGEPHRFHDIAEELVALVVFAPPESVRERPGDGETRAVS